MERFNLAFLVMGLSCAIGQVLLVREFMIIFSGNELTLGIIFVNWLLCIAIGSWVLGRFTDRLARKIEWFVTAQILVSIILPVQVLYTRALGEWIGRGEAVALFPTFYSTLLTLLPFCAIHGFQFTLGCKLYANKSGRSSVQISKVYFFEAIGSMIGGLLFTYLQAHYFHVFGLAVGLALLNLMLALIVLITDKTGSVTKLKRRLITGIIILLVAINTLALLSGKINDLHIMSYRWQWKDMDLVHYENSIYGNIAITQNNRQLDFWVDGLPLFTTPDPDTAFVEEVSHFPMLLYPSPKRVLLIGGGVGGVLEEILKHPVDEVIYVELDPLIIKLAREYSPAASDVLDDPRVGIVHVDGRLFVKRAGDYFDVIIVNLPPPSTLQLNRYYTLEFFREVQEILTEDGVFSLGLPSSLTYVNEEMRDRNKCVYDTLNEVFPSCLVIPGDFNIFLTSPSIQVDRLTYDTDTLHQRLINRGLKTSLFTREYIQYKFSLGVLGRGLEYLLGEPGRINRDLSPVGVYYDLVLWNVMFYPQAQAFFRFLSQISLWLFVIPLGLLMGGVVTLQRRLKRVNVPVFTAIITTGFTGMTFNIILIFAFQVLYGYLYQELGVMVAAFSLGLALGGLGITYIISKQVESVTALVKVELVVIAYAFLLPLSVMLLFFSVSEPLLYSWVRFVLPVLNGISGFLVGLEFLLASEICFKGDNRVGSVVGSLYASDLVGGCAGALLASIWLIPLLGVLGTCLVVASLNVASVILLMALRKSD